MSISVSGSQITFNDASTQNTAATGFGFKNRIINGAMMIDQRNAGASVSLTSNPTYTLDRWVATYTQNSKFTVQQNAGSVTPPAGFINYLGCTSTSAYSLASGDIFVMRQVIEGLNVADLGWGTANAQTVTLSFQVRSSLTGTFGGAIYNSTGARSYPFSYTVSSANTWTTVSITIAGDTSGTWLTTNGVGIQVAFSLGSGSTYSGTAGAWAGTLYTSATGATSVVGTNGATFYITGVQLEKGSTATSFDYRPYGTELALCQRYYQTSGSGTGVGATTSSVTLIFPLCVTMRTTPSVGLTGVYSITNAVTTDYVQSSATSSIIAGNSNAVQVSLTNFTATVAGTSYMSRYANSNVLTLSAEL